MRITPALPLWTRWLIGFGLAGLAWLVVEAAGHDELTYTYWAWVIFVWLVLFPGERVGFPRLFTVSTALWVLCVPVFLILVLSADAWNGVMEDVANQGQEAHLRWMLLPYVALFAALVVTLLRRRPAFRWLIVATALYDTGVSVLWYTAWHEATSGRGLWALALDVLLEVAVTAYFLVHFRPRPRTDPSPGVPAPQPSGDVVGQGVFENAP